MNGGQGDFLYLAGAPAGGCRLTPYDPALARTLEKGDDILRRYRNTLQTLAN